MNGILTVPEVAETLTVTEEYVRRLLRKKRLTGFKLGDVWRVKSEDLDAFIARRIKANKKISVAGTGARNTGSQADSVKEPDSGLPQPSISGNDQPERR